MKKTLIHASAANPQKDRWFHIQETKSSENHRVRRYDHTW